MAFVILFILAITVGFALWLHGSTGLAHEKVQTFLGYSLRFTNWFFSLLTIFVAIASISRDIKRREIFTIATKPIGRGQILLGKLLGMAMLNLSFLLVTVLSIYIVARVLQSTEPDSDFERGRIQDLVLVARRSVMPPVADVTAQARQLTDNYVQNQIDQGEVTSPQAISRLRAQKFAENVQRLQMRSRAVAPYELITFKFSDLQPLDRENGYVYIRFKQDVSTNPPGLALWNEWWFGPADPQSPQTPSYYVEPQYAEAIRKVHEFPVPVSAISDNDELYVAYRNNPINSSQGEVVVIFPPDTGIEALYVAGSFEGNLFRGFVLIFFRMLFLSILGIAAGAWLSFPVAVLLVLVIYFVGLASGFISEAIQYEAGVGQAAAINILLNLSPKLAAYDPVASIETGRIVELDLIGSGFVFLLLIKGGIVGGIGYLIFRFRELARVIV